MSQARTVARQLRGKGALHTLRRRSIAAGANAWTAGAATVTYFACRAFEKNTGTQQIDGGLLEAGFTIIVDPASLATVPQEGDQIALGTFAVDAGAEWRTVTNVDVRREAGAVRIYALTARA